MGSRRKGREYAVQLLYMVDLRGGGDVGGLFESFWQGEKYREEDRAFAETLARGTLQHLDDIDVLIDRHANNWKISRMPPVDRNIIRLGVFELCFAGDCPASVAINEAIELGKRFSGDEAAPFINGVLDRVHRECRKDGR